MHLSPGSYEKKSNEDGKFSLLRDLFEQSQETTMFSIDMKAKSEEICVKVNDLVKEYRLEDRVIWGSMYPS